MGKKKAVICVYRPGGESAREIIIKSFIMFIQREFFKNIII